MAEESYRQDKTDFNAQTLSLAQVLINAIQGSLYDTHTALPAIITKVNGNQDVDIQIQVKNKMKNGTLVDFPIIQKVHVCVPRGNDWWIKLPIAVGETGIALFASRSIDVWGVSGGVVDPKDTRHHELSDAIFIPGLYPFSNQVTGDADDLVIKNKDSQIVVKKDGKFQVKNNANELLDLLTQVVQAIIDARINTVFGPQQVINFATFTTLKTKLETLKG